MSTIVMHAPRAAQLLARVGQPILPAVDTRDRLARISQQSNGTRNGKYLEPHGRLQESERAGLRGLLCEMLATSVWEDGDGSVRKEGKNRVEDHNGTTRT